MSSIISIYNNGGILILFILLGSIISLTIFIERLFYLKKKNIASKNLYEELLNLISNNKISEASVLAKNKNEVLSRIMYFVLKNWNKDKKFLKELAEEKGKIEINNMEKNIEIISVIASLSPLMGLLGTVIGMISVFKDFVEKQQDPTFMSSGISQALITTAAGLIVAIPSIIASRYLLNKSETLTIDLEEKLFELIEYKNEN